MPIESIIKVKSDNRGSILIFVVLIIAVLAGVLTGVMSEQRLNLMEDNKTREYNDKTKYIEKFTSYLEDVSLARTDNVDEQMYGDIIYTLTRQVEAIEEFLLSGKISDPYDFSDTTNVTVEWNKCSSLGQKSGISISDNTDNYIYPATGNGCGNGDDFNDSIVLPNDDLTDISILAFGSVSAPISYRLAPNSGLISDNKWHLNAYIPIGDEGEVIQIIKTFK